MRGSPEFCHNIAAHDLVQAQQVELLARKKSEEEALCSNIENRIRLESALFAEVSPQCRISVSFKEREPQPVFL